MASEIEIVNISNFEKIENFLNDSAYKEILENSENFNTRLCIERRLRMPFLDPQTGVAQTHCALFMKQKQRMPGFREGQIYTYPSARWRKPKRQYLLHHHQSYKAYQFRENQAPHTHATHTSSSHSSSQHSQHHHASQAENTAAVAAMDGNSMSASGDNDSKDSHQITEKEWFYEDMENSHVEDFEEDFESDVDFEESYNSRRRKRPKSSKKSTINSESTPKRGRKGGGTGAGRRKATTGDVGNTEKRRGGNTSMASITNTPATVSASANNSIAMSSNSNGGGGTTTSTSNANASTNSNASNPSATSASSAVVVSGANTEDSQSSLLVSSDKMPTFSDATDAPEVYSKKDIKIKMRADREVAQPSPYCDFCLGDARENKKTNLPEELVSCSDCGRSGHPTCLQFTPNMIISVKRYRWQCIECKYCSICGTSDNDDQLLFCDDCDRGYHMYCLSPPLITPPEGSWSCKLCMDEFHGGEK